MDLPITLGLIAAFIATGVFCGWRGALPPDFKRGPRVIPWRPLMVVCAVGVMLLLAHVGTLLGAPRPG